jgi:ABC-type transport system involved in multi-copper enzyme maturation permease subunit
MTTISHPKTGPTTTARPTTQPFTRLVGVEIRKMADTITGLWLLIIIGVLTAGAIGYTFFAQAKLPDHQTFNTFLRATSTPQGLLLPVLGILLVTGEWSQRTGLITFTLTPARTRVLGAKLSAAVIYGLAAIGIAMALAALAALFGGADHPWNMTWAMLGKTVLIQIISILQGVALGLLILNSAGAITSYFVLPAAVGMTRLSDQLRDVGQWIDMESMKIMLARQMTDRQWAQLACCVAIWVLVPMILGTVRVIRSEVK